MKNFLARPGQHRVVTSEHLQQVQYRAVMATVLVSIAVLLWVPRHWLLFERERVINPTIESSCKWPRHEGEMTVVTVINQKVICWRWH